MANTLWFRYTAPSSGLVQFDLRDGLPWEIERSAITIFSGARGSLVFRDCGAGTGGLPVTFPASAGETYHIMVTGFFGSATFHAERIELPPNDSLTGARTIAPLPFQHRVYIQGATADSSDPAPACTAPPNQTVWYRYAATSAQPLTLDVVSPGKAVIGVWSGTPGSLTPVACTVNDDPSLSFTPVPGQTYFVMVGGSDLLGSLTVNAWTPVQGPPILCPAKYDLETVWEGALLSKQTPVVVQPFVLTEYDHAALVVWSAAGHPEAGCPLTSSYLCGLPDQLHEQFRSSSTRSRWASCPTRATTSGAASRTSSWASAAPALYRHPALEARRRGRERGLPGRAVPGPAPRPTGSRPSQPPKRRRNSRPSRHRNANGTADRAAHGTAHGTAHSAAFRPMPGRIHQNTQWLYTLILNSSPRVDLSFAGPAARTSCGDRVDGRPSGGGLPRGSSWLCSLPDQTTSSSTSTWTAARWPSSPTTATTTGRLSRPSPWAGWAGARTS